MFGVFVRIIGRTVVRNVCQSRRRHARSATCKSANLIIPQASFHSLSLYLSFVSQNITPSSSHSLFHVVHSNYVTFNRGRCSIVAKPVLVFLFKNMKMIGYIRASGYLLLIILSKIFTGMLSHDRRPDWWLR